MRGARESVHFRSCASLQRSNRVPTAELRHFFALSVAAGRGSDAGPMRLNVGRLAVLDGLSEAWLQ